MFLVVSITVLVLIWGAQFKLRPLLVVFSEKLFFLSVWLAVFNCLALSLWQYYSWLQDPLTVNFLPPFQGIGYYLFYIFYRIWIIYLIPVVFSLVFIFLADYFNKKKNNVFFERGEVYLAGLSMVLSGYPGVIFYFIVFLFLFLAASLIATLIKGRNYRISPYFLWIPTSICVIILNNLWLSNSDFWKLIKF